MTCASTEHRGPCSSSLSVLTVPTMLSSLSLLALFFSFFLSCSFVGFLSLLCEPAIHFAVSSSPSPRARFLAPFPRFFSLVLRDANDLWLSPDGVYCTRGPVSVLPTTPLFFQSGHIVTVSSGPAGVLFLILELSQFLLALSLSRGSDQNLNDLLKTTLCF